MPHEPRHIEAWLVATSLVVCASIALVRCNDAVCGNGKREGSEACDVGKLNGVPNSGCSATCTIAALNLAPLNINITRLQNEAMGYDGATCTDLGVASMHVVLDGPSGFDKMLDCATESSYLIPDVTPGDYTVTVTLLGSANAALTNPVVSDMVKAATNTTAQLAVNFTQEDFIKQDYVGILYFAPSWGADNTTCTMASPAVTGYGVTLKDDTGKIVPGISTAKRTFDGTQGPCFVPSSNGTSEATPTIAWGHYSITFTGYAAQNQQSVVAYCGSFDVFNGPSLANMTYALTVPTAGGDAGACD